MPSVAPARASPSRAESVAFNKQQRAQAEKRAEEKRIVKETHESSSFKTKSVKDLRVSSEALCAHEKSHFHGLSSPHHSSVASPSVNPRSTIARVCERRPP